MIVSLQPCDLTNPPTVRRWSISPYARTARIDVPFNNAAIAYFNWLEDITDEEWNRDLREEIDLVFFLTRAAWPHLKTSHGVVVNTASLNGLMSFKMLGSLAHTTAKAGIIGMVITHVRVGFNGYWLQQTTEDKVNGINLPHSLERTVGLGAGIQYFSGRDTWIHLNGYQETDVRNRAQGYSVTLRFSKAIPSSMTHP
jgi:Putative MetA-pathway of phenol degradation/Enoyl-(Acyl carrier protein) reductase